MRSLLILLLMSLGPAVGSAQAPEEASAQAPEEDVRAEARGYFQEGEAAFAEEAFERALRLFRRAFELRPHDAVRFNIAVCLEELSRFDEALEQYDAAARSEQLGPEARTRARIRAEELRAEMARAAEPADGPRPEEQRAAPTPAEVAVASEPASPSSATRGEPIHEDARGGGSFGWLGWTGAAVAVVGGVGITLFGLRAQTLHDQYVNDATIETRDEGILMRDLANASIGVAAVGATAVLLDLLVLRSGD